MVRPQVALSAVLGHPRRGRTEGVPPVARRARSLASVGIESPDAAIRPAGRVKFSIAQILHFASVALAAAVVGRRSAFHNFAKHVVQRSDELCRGGMLVFL